MARAYLPFHCYPSAEAEKIIGDAIGRVALLALEAILANGKGLEIAHQQIRWRGHDLAFSSRVSGSGELILDIDLGDPRLAGRIVLEEELRREMRQVRGIRSERRGAPR
jgi:hypothetical protein